MKQLRSAAFLSLIVFLIVLLSRSSSGQSAQTPSLSPAGPATGDAIKNLAPLNAQANAAQPSDMAWRRPVIGQVVASADHPAIDAWADRAPGRTRLRAASQAPDRKVDPGIFLKQSDGNICGSIVSYNFSPGENPQLQSVTTCTPRGWIATRRAQGKDKKPPAPLFQTTEYSGPQH